MRFGFPKSHAYPGSPVVVHDDAGAERTCLVEFGDGVVVVGTVIRDDHGGFVLDVPQYRTAKGSDVAPRQWRVVGTGPDAWRARRV